MAKAKAAGVPPSLPMKATTAELPTGPGWIYELKWDGMRIVAAVQPGLEPPVELWSARGTPATGRFGELAGLVDATHDKRVILDGEVVALDDEGRPSFSRLQRRMHIADPAVARRLEGEVPVAFIIFDLLKVDELDLCGLPLSDRRRALEDLVEPGPSWQLATQHPDGPALLAAVEKQGLEGIVAKRLDSTYVPGKRTTAWRKVKVRRRQELVVGGWADGQGALSGAIGSLLVGYYDGGALRFAGRVGSGLNDRTQAELPGLLGDEVEDCPFEPPPPRLAQVGAHWVEPRLVIEVAFAEWTPEGILRQPSYLGRHADREPADVVREPSP